MKVVMLTFCSLLGMIVAQQALSTDGSMDKPDVAVHEIMSIEQKSKP